MLGGRHAYLVVAQQQAGCALRGQRYLPLALLRPRQQEEAHDPPCRGVPAPLSAPPAAAGPRAYPQLRIPGHPQPRYPVDAVPSTTRRLREKDRTERFTVHRPDSLTLELPGLRGNHACCRTAFRRPTPASLSTATRPVRCMNLGSHPRPLTVLWHACRSLASTSQDYSATDLSSYRTTRPCNASPAQFIYQSNSSDLSQRVLLLAEHLRPHSKYIGFPVGGFLQVAVLEAPPQNSSKLKLLPEGAPVTALRLRPCG
jgi:hypothetical protein